MTTDHIRGFDVGLPLWQKMRNSIVAWSSLCLDLNPFGVSSKCENWRLSLPKNKHVSHWWWQYLDFLFVTLYIARAACGAVVHRVLPVISSNHLQAFHLGLNTTNKEPSWNLDAIYSDIILNELIFSKEKNSWMHFDLNRHHWHSFS